MNTHKIAVIGGGFAGISLIAEIVRASSSAQRTNLSITLFEPNIIGPGLAYDINGPDAFKLNHELDFMGSVNVNLAQTDSKDFYRWVQQHLADLQPLYPSYDLTNPKEYVPRSLFGRYLQARYAELKAYAASQGIVIHENKSTIDTIDHLDGHFVITVNSKKEYFDVAALTTGTYFTKLNPALAQTGKYFRPYDYTTYMSDVIADGSVMLVAGSALSAYDAAIYALESGKYSKVVMASRRGMLRKVRGNTRPYVRKYVTLSHLEAMAGGSDMPFRLDHLIQAVKAELKHAYGRTISWKEGYSIQEIFQMLKSDIAAVKNGDTLLWRSIHSSLTDDERHEIFDRLALEDKQEFVRKYSSLYQLFSAPMPITNATKLLRYIEEGKLELVNGIQAISFNEETGKFEIQQARYKDGTPLPLDAPMEEHPDATVSLHPTTADVCIDAMGLGRNIHHLPLYRNLMTSGLATSNALGGIAVDITSRRVINAEGATTSGLYAVGHMACGETVLPHNSLQLSRACISTGAAIVTYLETKASAKNHASLSRQK